ncbi:sporulation protein RMD8 [Cordyceps fumosorosea ARSEF 2679]|uniref:Sporulation protein RMD8 n=1 Tax=Cordyceps fumosorosea (strain ARSEF 2679) TaxID=1081104 RepID=A0A168E9I7_CORFA|nr:sporulation protein RMD8 [Cordyceps fumosorosea ARSEF 2679]OAA73540.1 sporulation protein RMD8 [Cordyceps fumosorosea ARSEF 2679]
MSSGNKQRAPSVLVTDSRARERINQRRIPQRPDALSRSPGRVPMRFMTVDNVLQFSSQIPSGQPRGPPAPSAGLHGAGPVHPRRVVSGGLPNVHSRAGQPMPSRTTKISEKLVLLPETADDKEDAEDEIESDSVLARRFQADDDRPLRDEELDVLRKRGGIRGKSYAERLPKKQRKDKVSRLTAYCTAQAFKIKATAEFLKEKHEAKTKLYDDCLYVIYALPLMNGTDGYRVRGRPILKTPGTGKTVLDLEIERTEQRGHHEGYFEDDAYTMPESPEQPSHVRPGTHEVSPDEAARRQQGFHPPGDDDGAASPMGRLAGGPAHAKNFAEMFVFSYGVVVFWNFTEYQEKDILADLTFADAEDGVSLLTRPLEQHDFETEEFHFEYSEEVKRPRIFNDMITLMPRSDHMIKLTISHAIAQSTKLCLFEERLGETMLDAQDVPKTLALTGELNMTRTEIVKILGRLFKSRVDINLSSNILDVPNFFWDSEPTLHPLYAAIREYLEIDPRIKVLNERCRVFLDLAEILSDSVNDAKMSAITWIVIVLILVSILVTVTEVGLRFAMLERSKQADNAGAVGVLLPPAPPQLRIGPPGHQQQQQQQQQQQVVGPLEELARTLGLEANATLDDVKGSIRTLQDGAAAAAAPARVPEMPAPGGINVDELK